ncbi:MAG: hypothetical protein ABW194_02080 [Novosphingobium sp.]
MNLDRSLPGGRDHLLERGGRLRPLDWAGLCARLLAAQHARQALASVAVRLPRPGSASFGGFAVPFVLPLRKAAPAVNLEPLADGKAGRAKPGAPGEPRTPANPDRGLR